VLALAGCGNVGQRAQKQATPEPGDIVTALVGDLTSEASASGQLRPQQDATLALGTGGQVTEVYVQAGDWVQEGEVFVRLESGDLERAVRAAEQELAVQEANLTELRKDPQAADVAAAQEAVANARAQLDDLLAGPSEQDLARAEASLASAEAQLADLLEGPSEEELAQAQALLDSAQAGLRAAQARSEALDDQLVVAQNDIDNAQLAKDRARDQYDQLVWNDWKAGVSWAPYSPAGAAVKKAEAGYEAAVANYNLTELQINDSALRQAEHQVAQAEAALAALTEEKTAQIAAASAQVARAESGLSALTEEKTVQIAAASAQLEQAEASLKKLLDGASVEQLAMAEAQVEQARISLDEAQENLKDATLVAPFDGLVTDVYVTVGEWANGPAVELVNTESLQVVLNVDEVDIGHIAVGQSAVVTLEAWPDRELSGKVASIAPQARVLGEVVTFEVHVDLDAEDLPVLTGMTANAELKSSEREGVLLVPNRAITADRQVGKYHVNKVDGDEVTKVEVTIGLRDGSYTEITSGLQEGDQVSIAEERGSGLDMFSEGPPRESRGIH
jgi:HlyD family secretion protein